MCCGLDALTVAGNDIGINSSGFTYSLLLLLDWQKQKVTVRTQKGLHEILPNAMELQETINSHKTEPASFQYTFIYIIKIEKQLQQL